MSEKQGGKYGALIKQAKQAQPENQLSGKPEDQEAIKPEVIQEKQVNLCVKVPESWRRHWAAQAKLQGQTMTDVMVEALTTVFGLPENQKTR
ncbi:MAG: hypothetical protein EA367_00310 [Leptolyngbya sp. DLM2.Bin15]|nr:MAG: hypothetical protein EA367_00310 [Leptolyngbya sp. DLM2.Bin15]